MNAETRVCPHCGKVQPTPPPAPVRRFLVLVVGVELLLVTLLLLPDFYRFAVGPLSLPTATYLVLGGFGMAYLTYLWISFLLIGILKLPGCEFTAIRHAITRRPIHVCVDSILNSVLDTMQLEQGLSAQLLRTESAQKWILGAVLLSGFLLVIVTDFVPADLKLVAVGVFASVYLIYDRTIHGVSIGRKDLTGTGDYRRILSRLFSGGR
ncbi:MAG: hypothetical protein ACE5I4_01710 [Thermoplasmata archaeon]